MLTARLTPLLVPLTVAPSVGVVIDAVRPGGGGVPPHVAPEGTTGDAASLLIVTAVDTAQLPALSVATAWTWFPGITAAEFREALANAQLEPAGAHWSTWHNVDVYRRQLVAKARHLRHAIARSEEWR